MSAEQEEICRGVADTQHPALVHVHGKTRAPAQVLMCGCDLNTTLPNESLPGEPAGAMLGTLQAWTRVPRCPLTTGERCNSSGS